MRILAFLLLVSPTLFAQISLQAGPMLGYVEHSSAVLWLQANGSATAYALCDDLTTAGSAAMSSDTITLRRDEAFSGRLHFDQLLPGSRYRYRIFLNGKEQTRPYPLEFSTPKLWAHREDPPAFRMVIGSCVYINEPTFDRPGKPYGGEAAIFSSILARQPEVMLWLGDNTYLRAGEWWTRAGYQHRYSHTRALPELQPLLASCQNFAIWDDHEFGPNDAPGSWVMKEQALESFKQFWANHTYGYPDLPGIMSAFSQHDIEVVLMDNRWYRSEQMQVGQEQIFGRKQCDRLIDLLKFSRAPFKLVATGGQFLNTAKVYENHANYEEERAYLLRRIEEEDISGVVFLSGDRHHSEISRYTMANGKLIYDITCSPLTAGPNTSVDEVNELRVKDSLIKQRNFALLSFSGPQNERQLKIEFFNVAGQLLFNHTIGPNE